jgi:hypothetical protein
MNCVAIVNDFSSAVLFIEFAKNGKEIIIGDEDGNVSIRQTHSLNNFTKIMTFLKAISKVLSLNFPYIFTAIEF